MAVTRKDYVLIAATLRREYETALSQHETLHVAGIQVAAEALADAFQNTYENFDRSRFLSAAVRGDGPTGLKQLLTF